MKSRKMMIIMTVFTTIFLLTVMGAGLAGSQSVVNLREEMLNLFGRLLSPRQLKILADFRRAKLNEAYEKMLAYEDLAERAKKVLRLSDSQEDELLSLISAHMEEIMTAVEPFFADEKAIREALFSEAPAESVLRQQAALLGEHLGEAGLLAARLIQISRSVLTPEQNAMLDELYRTVEVEEQRELDRLAESANELITLWKDLALSPAQLKGLADLTEAAVKLADRHRQWEERLLEARLRWILSPHQMKVLAAFRRAHEAEMEAERDEILQRSVSLVYELDLSQEQMDALVALVERNREAILASAESVIESAILFRDEVLAGPDEGRIRAVAAQVGEVSGDALVLTAEMIRETRTILSVEQMAAIVEMVIFAEDKAAEAKAVFPDRFAELVQLRADLNLTPVQKDALFALAEEKQHELKRQLDILRRLP